jgi:uncharacterized membrane protein (UPF0127 family)
VSFERRHGSGQVVTLRGEDGVVLELRVASGAGRMTGLIGVRRLPPATGLLIPRCDSVHTVGMRMPIDVAFLRWPARDGRSEVLAVREAMRPWRLAGVRARRHGVRRREVAAVELAAGEAVRLGLHPGAVLSL